MKCELCHNANAETVLIRGEGDSEEELYVCSACAKAERLRRQKQSQRTRKVSGLPPGVSMSITEVEGGEAPPFIGAIVNAFQDMVNGLGKKEPAASEARLDYHDFPCSRVDATYRIGARLHLEGLHLIGELDAVKRGLHALQMDIVGVTADGVKDSGHVYMLRYTGSSERVKRVVEDLLREERNARVRLFDELPRVFGDSLCRALAILKNCRMLSPAEFFDLLSPLRLAMRENLLEGISAETLEKMIADIDLSSSEDSLSPNERDRVDAERADAVNRQFENVMLNETAEGKFL